MFVPSPEPGPSCPCFEQRSGEARDRRDQIPLWGRGQYWGTGWGGSQLTKAMPGLVPPHAAPELGSLSLTRSLHQSGTGTAKTPLTSNHCGPVRAPPPPREYPISKSGSGPPVKEVRPIICDVPN